MRKKHALGQLTTASRPFSCPQGMLCLFVKEDRLSVVLIKKKINAMSTFVFSVGIMGTNEAVCLL